MSKRSLYFSLSFALVSALSVYLYDSEPQQPMAAAEEVADPSPVETAVTQKPTPEAETTEGSDTKSEAAATVVAEEQSLAEEFEFPFPERVNLFQAPQRQGRGLVSSNGQSKTEIELLGFVNVREQQVVLSVDGLVASLSEGSTEHGIEVISIQPPAVVLKRGGQRWQASLAN